MTIQEHTIAVYRVKKADESLAEAKILLENNFFNGATGKSYYAAFYIVSALLLTQQLSSKTHKGVRILFGKHFVEVGIFPRAVGTTFSNLFRFRQEGDYDDLSDIDVNLAQSTYNEAQEFVRTVKDYLIPILNSQA